MHGTVKSYDADKKQLAFTDKAKDWTFAMGDAKVRLNKEDSKIEQHQDRRQGARDRRKDRGRTTLKCLMIERK